MRRLLLAVTLAGCGGAAPPMVVAERCSAGDLRIEVEAGNPARCADLLVEAEHYRSLYDARFGREALGVPVRVRAADHLTVAGFEGWTGITGTTYADAIDLAAGSLVTLPHELHHVRTGPSHAGWCLDYSPWSSAVLGRDEARYLGCAP